MEYPYFFNPRDKNERFFRDLSSTVLRRGKPGKKLKIISSLSKTSPLSLPLLDHTADLAKPYQCRYLIIRL